LAGLEKGVLSQHEYDPEVKAAYRERQRELYGRAHQVEPFLCLPHYFCQWLAKFEKMARPSPEKREKWLRGAVA